MLLRNSLGIVLKARNLLNTKSVGEFKQIVRNSHSEFAYRANTPPPSKTITYLANGAAGFAWWWIFWHLWHEPGHVFGEFPYPDPSKWTNEELGIPNE